MTAAAPFTTIDSLEELEAVFEASRSRPTLLFLHDPFCGTSHDAYFEVSAISYPVTMIEVPGKRALTRVVEERTGVQHESPQILLLQDGAARWNADHWRITAQAIKAALEQSGATAEASSEVVD